MSPIHKSSKPDDAEASAAKKKRSTKQVSFNEELERSQQNEELDTSDESEDDDAVLLTGKVENKIFETLLSIKNKDPAIYDPSHKIFYDSDFEEEESEASKASKKVTYKDMVSETLLRQGPEALGSDDEDQRNTKNIKTYQDEQEELKKAFLTAAEEIDGETDFFKKSSTLDALPEAKLKPSGASSKRLGENAEGIISRYWAADQAQDPDEEFLRDYILNQRWREDKRPSFEPSNVARIDEEDEQHLDEADEFEYKYNYRFEEEDGAKIVGHPRNIEDSVRKPEDRRKRKRQEKKEQQQEQKLRREQELKRLKNLKKSEIEKRLKEIEATAGVALTEDTIDLNAPFDPKQHKKDMKQILGSGYHKEDDTDWNPVEDYQSGDNDLWWLCDHCQKGIPAGKKHFDCLECENYSLCESCVPLADHEHLEMRAQVVPTTCAPPVANEEELAKMLDEYYQLDYEDMIGDLKVRYKYRKVEPYKCDLQTILEKSDRELNAMMPLNKLLAHDAELLKAHKKKRHYDPSASGDKASLDRRMTKYNVNRDRLQAFGLKDKKKQKHSKKQKHTSTTDNT